MPNQFPADTINEAVIRDVRLGYPAKPSAETIDCLVKKLKAGLIEEGLVKENDQDRALRRWAETAFRIARKFGEFPFTAQSEIVDEFKLSRLELIALNAVLRGSNTIQTIICDLSPTKKYWRNTIIPTVRSESFSAALEGRYLYPFRVGIFPGQSCMFKCNFCGRNYDAVYQPTAREPGNLAFQTMIKEAPRFDLDRFYFSGGLEPLTNPGLGSLIKFGRGYGFRTSMYTNGYMLVPKFLESDSGLWDLDTVRLSLYGVNEEGAFDVTGKKGSFDRVKANVANFIARRNALGAETKLGVNFVILSQNLHQMLSLADLVTEINHNAGGPGIKFLTIREDFGVAAEAGLSDSDRAKMLAVFEEFEDRLNKESPEPVEIDYGYALQATRDGFAARPLEMAGDDELRSAGFPQISVVVDLYGDTYIYREAGFLDRPGAIRYSIGRITQDRSLSSVVQEFVESGRKVAIEPEDWKLLDAFDHVIVKLLNQAESDLNTGIPFNLGPVRDRMIADGPQAENDYPVLAHPTLASTQS